jgi:hypothetical protein
MPLKNPITEPQIPQAMARDSEVVAAINGHVLVADPHTQYATQARADERYGSVKKYILYGTTANTQGGNAAIPHGGLIVSKILAINAVVEHAPGTIVAPGHVTTAGYEFDLSANSSAVYVGNIATKSFNILSKPVRIVIDYLI